MNKHIDSTLDALPVETGQLDEVRLLARKKMIAIAAAKGKKATPRGKVPEKRAKRSAR